MKNHPLYEIRLKNLNMHMSMGPNEMHPWVLRELLDEGTKLLQDHRADASGNSAKAQRK